MVREYTPDPGDWPFFIGHKLPKFLLLERVGRINRVLSQRLASGRRLLLLDPTGGMR